MVKPVALFSAAAVVFAVPAIVYETVKETIYVTEYMDGALPGETGVHFVTMWPSAYTNTSAPTAVSTLPAPSGGYYGNDTNDAAQGSSGSSPGSGSGLPGSHNSGSESGSGSGAGSGSGSGSESGSRSVSGRGAVPGVYTYTHVYTTVVPGEAPQGYEPAPHSSEGEQEGYIVTSTSVYTTTVQPSKGVESLPTLSSSPDGHPSASFAAPHSSSGYQFNSSSITPSTTETSSITWSVSFTASTVSSTAATSSSAAVSSSSSTSNGLSSVSSVSSATTSSSATSSALPSASSTTTTSSTITSSASSTASSTSSTTTSSSAAGPQVTTAPQYMVYSPFNADRTCKDANTVKQDLQNMVNKNIFKIRMYATDCDSLHTVQPAARELGMTIMQGVWIGSGSATDNANETTGTQNAISQIQDIITNANGDWSLYESITVGNEDVTNGFITADQLLHTIQSAKALLRAAGYHGPVGAPETTGTFMEYPNQLCGSALDFITLNAHSYFAPTFSPDQAGAFMIDQINKVVSACGRQDILISETGYPHKGSTNGLNVPTKENQAIAVNSILNTLQGNCVILAEYDDYWKDPGYYGIEQYFGVLDIITV